MKDTRQSEIELSENVVVTSIPTYHWSEILNPRYKDVFDLLGGSVTTTQKVNPNGTTAKTTRPTPACVVYDEEFIQYQLLEVIAPFICAIASAKSETEEPTLTNPVDPSVELFDQLVSLLSEAFENSMKWHDNATQLCEDMGVTLRYEPKLMLRSFKLAIAASQKNKKFLDSLDD